MAENQGSAMDSTSAINRISGNFWILDGVGQVIPNKALSKKVWISCWREKTG